MKTMKMKKLWIAAAAAVVVVLAWGVFGRGASETSAYRFVPVERGDIEVVVTATGSLQATETVEVGTQVSGQVAALYVDFNDRVEAGQLLARIDPTLLQQEVRSSEASVARSRADLEQAERELERATELHAKQVVTDSERDQAQYQYDVAEASYAQAQINLERAHRNLEYSEVRAPIDGVVVARSADVGQTVAASLSAPTLFMIAQDLSEMEILARVDESDIGRIEQGQEVRFTVQAYPDRRFTGTVEQVRLESASQESVVSYGVVIAVSNDDRSLLPGMTAMVEFVVDSAPDVLMVANTALRFRPTEEMRQAMASRMADGRTGAARDSGAVRGAGANGAMRERGAEPLAANGAARGVRAAADGSVSMLWYLNENGDVAVARVRTGLSDGQNTMIVQPPEVVQEGLQVIAAVTNGTAAPAAASNPFQGEASGPRRPGGGF